MKGQTPRLIDPQYHQVGGQLIYGRVAGVQLGSSWQAHLVDEGSTHLAIPPSGQAISFAISTLRGGRLETIE
ncbi:MAG: DUF3370 family protein [Symploca sp. SIO3E6]|nr:DUF3370 family protein [Caldora sp. SIO3E6]